MGLKNIQDFKKELSRLQTNYETDDSTREDIITLARKALKPAKQAIYAAHRNELVEAEKLLDVAKDAINDAKKRLDTSGLQDVGMLNAGIEEYIEGLCYLSFIKTGSIPLIADLKLTFDTKPETYLQAICDFAGELSRRAVIAATKNEKSIVVTIHEVLEELLEQFMKFDFRSSELRKKTENIKYSLNKVEGILYDLKVHSR